MPDKPPSIATALRAWHAAEHARMDGVLPAKEAPAGAFVRVLREWHGAEHAKPC